jgi:hypothetical protein
MPCHTAPLAGGHGHAARQRHRLRGPRQPPARPLPVSGRSVACDGWPPIARLPEQYAEAGGELLVCPSFPDESEWDAALQWLLTAYAEANDDIRAEFEGELGVMVGG